MSKRLILILALAFVVGIAFAAFAEVQNVKVSGDLSAAALTRRGFNLGVASGVAADKERADGIVGIARVKIDADLTDNVMVTVRLLNERVWGTLEETNLTTDIDLDLAYVTLKEFLNNDKVTLIVGTQPLRLGNGLLVGDADTNRAETAAVLPPIARDLSVRKAFDAIVAVLDYSPLKITAGFVKGLETAITDSRDDVNVYLVQGAYDFKTKNTKAELTLMADDRDKTDTYNYGLLVTSTPMDNLNVSAEYVYQTGKGIRDDKKMAADGALQLMADYTLKNVSMTPKIGIDYTRLSRNWNVSFEDQTPADIVNLLFAQTNMQIIGASLCAKPMDDVNLKLRYANLRLIKNVASIVGYNTYTLDSEKKALGDEIDLSLTYDYTEDVQLGLSAGYFIPGAAFDSATDNAKSASQVLGSMKVTF